MSEKEFDRKMYIETLLFIFYNSVSIIALNKLTFKGPDMLVMLVVAVILLLISITITMVTYTYDELKAKKKED